MRASQNVIELRDIPAAIGFLTRLPVRVDGSWAMTRGARNAWAYPLAGAVVGLILLGVAWATSGIFSFVAAGFVLAAGIIVTGALHEDGLADSADGLWGGWTPERRLAIMKDSHIGTYGVIALVISLALRWFGFAAALESTLWLLVAVPAASRAAMVPLMLLPHARPGGVSSTVGRPPALTAGLAVAMGIAFLLPLGWMGVGMLVAMGLVALAIALIASAKIRGQTGDILGATQQLTEIAAWTAVFLAL